MTRPNGRVMSAGLTAATLLVACGGERDGGEGGPSRADRSAGEAVGALLTGPDVAADEGRCVGMEMVESLGVDRVRELGLVRDAQPSTSPVETAPAREHVLLVLGMALAGDYEKPDAEKTVDAFVDCAEQWKVVFVTGLTDGADEISATSAACVTSKLSDDDARAMFVAELDRADPTLAYLDPLMRAYDECLTTEERDRLDFN